MEQGGEKRLPVTTALAHWNGDWSRELTDACRMLGHTHCLGFLTQGCYFKSKNSKGLASLLFWETWFFLTVPVIPQMCLFIKVLISRPDLVSQTMISVTQKAEEEEDCKVKGCLGYRESLRPGKL